MKFIRNAWNRWLLLRRGTPWADQGQASRAGDRLAFAVFAATAMWIGSEYIVTDPQRAFNPYGSGYIAGYFLLVLAACYASTRIANRALLFTQFASAFLAGQAIVIGIFVIVGDKLPGPGQPYVVTSFDIADIAEVVLLTGTTYVAALKTLQIGRIAPMFLTIVPITAMAMYSQLPRIPLWYTAPPAQQASAEQQEHISVEWTYYDQYPLTSRALEALAQPRPSVTDLYFVGFAGYAGQDVFRKEVIAAQQLFDDRFDTKNRSMLLINNRATIKDTPLANGHNLWHALRELGERIDREDDIVFLFLTSHGTQNLLSVDFWPLQPDNLEPDDLRTMFDKAGIKWRVIVVSACYSGSFIDELQDDNTLIITAAHSEKKSFGCSNEAEFTYFGRAYFDEALRGTFSFVDAFRKAAKIIAEREKTEGLSPSEPQIAIGKAMQTKLKKLQKSLSVRYADQMANSAARAPDDMQSQAPENK